MAHPDSGAENLKPRPEIKNPEGSGILARETYDLTVHERIDYRPSEEVDDGDIYDEAVDVRELHKNDENLVDGWTTENPAERDRRIEKHMEEHGKILDGYDRNEK